MKNTHGSARFFLGLSCVTVISVTLWLLGRLMRWYRSRLFLLRRGLATVGTILHKRADSSNSVRYFVRYGYARQDTRREREEEVNAEQWKRFEVGQPVTVLYDPDDAVAAGLFALIVGK